MNLKCPNCKQDMEIEGTALKFHKHGRQATCPNCKRVILFKRFIRQTK